MKNMVWGAVGVILLGALAYGAVKTYVIDPKTVSSAEEILELFYETRASLPPIPSPVNYQDVMGQLNEGRFDFAASPGWAFNHDGGTYYLAEHSKLAGELQLPAKLLAYEDLASGRVVLAGIPVETGKLQRLAVVDAPEFAPFDKTTSVERYLMKELWPRRIIWTATLKPEADAWLDLVQTETENTLLRSAGVAEQYASSIPSNAPENFNGIPADYILELGINSTGSQVQVGWYGMRGFSYELWGTDNLQYSGFQSISNSIVGGDTSIVVNVAQSNSQYFFKVDVTVLDDDGDNLPDCWEFLYFGETNLYTAADDPDLDGLINTQEFAAATQPNNPDTDDDGMWDGYEVYYDFDPQNGSAHQTNSSGKAIGPEDDFDGDGVLNLDEYIQGTFPDRPNFNLTETNNVVTWFGQSDWRYQLLGSTTNLVSGNWVDLGISRLGENKEIVVDVSPYSQTYFRVVVSGYDADGDGLINVLERQQGTDPDNPDSDDDGMWDNFEVYYGFDPLNGSAHQTNSAGKYIGPKDDFDGDGLFNIDEYNHGTFPDRPDFGLSETNNMVEWFGQFGWHYQLQGAVSPATTNWVDLGLPIAGDNTVISTNVGQFAGSYFRVEVSEIDLTQAGSYTSLTEVTYGLSSYGNITSGYEVNRTVNTASAGYSGVSSSPINGMLRIPEGDGPFPLAIIVHGWSSLPSGSEDGYLYLCDQLASHGIITATIDENVLNDFFSGEIAARAIVLLEHVKQFKIWNETDGHPLENKVDMGKVMLIGHSRGGEALEHASFFNRLGPTEADPATDVIFNGAETNSYLGPYGFDLKALVAIAPTEGRYYDPSDNDVIIRRSVRDNYFIMHGSNDGDVKDFQGYRTYERAQPIDLVHPLDMAEGCKGLMWIYGANHKRFNTEWGSGVTPTLSYESHTNIAKYCATAIAYAELYGCDYGLSAFRDNRFANTFLPGIDFVTQYQDATRRFINHYDDDDDWATLSAPHAGSNDWTCTLSEIDFLHEVQEFRGVAPGANDAACMQWGTTGKVYTVNLDDSLDAGPYNVLSCRIAQYYAEDNNIQINMEVSDDVASGEFDLSDYATVLYPSLTRYDHDQDLSYDRRVVMQTVRIPLADIEAAGVDIHSIKIIELKFSHPTTDGIVYFDDLQFSK